MLRTEYLTSSYSCSRNVLDGEIDKDLMEVIPSLSPWVRIICEKIVHCRRIMSDKNRSFKSVRSTFSNFPVRLTLSPLSMVMRLKLRISGLLTCRTTRAPQKSMEYGVLCICIGNHQLDLWIIHFRLVPSSLSERGSKHQR